MGPIGYIPAPDPADPTRHTVIKSEKRGPLVAEAFRLYATGKAAILAVALDKVVLRPDDSYVTWREPFGMLCGLRRAIKNNEWDQSGNEFITYIRHSPPQEQTTRSLRGEAAPGTALFLPSS
jgi:hypothetical protein